MLCSVLILQIGLIVVINMRQGEHKVFEPQQALLTFDSKKVDGIRLDGDQDKHMELKKQGGQWLIASFDNFPADAAGVTSLLDRLVGLKKGWPVASSAEAAKRFKVDEQSFNLKITLTIGGKPSTALYVGTSLGLRKVHMRTPDDKSIYAIEFNQFEASTSVDDWIDKAILSPKVNEIDWLEMPGISLKRHGDKFVLDNLLPGQEMNEDEVTQLMDQVAGLRIKAVLGKQPKAEYRQDSPIFSYTVHLKSGGEPWTYLFSKPDAEEYLVLKVSNRSEYFKVDNWVANVLKGIAAEKLVQKKEKASAAPGA